MKILRFSLIFILFYIYCFSIVFTFFPVSTKIILGGIGLVYTIIKLASGRLRLKKEFVWILKYSVFLCLWDIVLSVISGYYQFHFFELIKTPIGSLFGAGLFPLPAQLSQISPAIRPGRIRPGPEPGQPGDL